LLKWIEQILETDDEVPPLTLSGLDHRVRDGFCLHILPLLLRKPDIHVNVQTRLQRRTTYDLAVTVEPTNTILDDSAASTTVSSNLIEPSARLSYDEFAEPNIKSPDDEEEREMTGSWTSNISGALWGSLKTASTRRKPANADVEEPYHRVVSAPAGRIGVTFVEYRGHCMVSDVAIDSPLLHWVYPSDVLIAIDEVPVSGMRVRDIIKVLKDRSEKPRALRVVSSHSMSTLTAAHRESARF
jgi:C-terminal processing protease CtpA/Prc